MTFSIRDAASGDDASWDEFVSNHPRGSHYHQSAWRSVIREVTGHRTLYLAARSNSGDVHGVLPMVHLRSRLFGSYMVSMPYLNYGGALGSQADVELALMEEAGTRAAAAGASHIEFRDVLARDGAWIARTDKVAMELTLPETSAELWQTFKPKLRAQIRRPEREGMEAVTGREELLDEFYTVFARNMRDLGTPVYSKRLFARILAAFPERSRIVVIRLRKAPAAAGFLLGYNGRLEIPWASSLRELNSLGVNMRLYWEVLEGAIRDGYRTFDFGRSTREGGTYRFKRQWGATPIQLNWHYWLAPGRDIPTLRPDSPRFALAVRTWQRLPVWLTKRLGPGIVKNLP